MSSTNHAHRFPGGGLRENDCSGSHEGGGVDEYEEEEEEEEDGADEAFG